MNEQLFERGQHVKYSVDNQRYIIEHVTQTAGTPSERFYVLRLFGRYSIISPFGTPAITHTLPESYAKNVLTIIKQ